MRSKALKLFFWGCASHLWTLALFSAGSALSGCDAPDLVLESKPSPTDELTAETNLIPENHPCPEWAQAPQDSQLWRDTAVVPLALGFPTPVGMPVEVTQAYPSAYTHQASQGYAIDFAVPFGTPVHSAASGFIVWAEDDFRAPTGTLLTRARPLNYMVIDHGGGLFTQYAHLEAGSILFEPGEWIPAGTHIANTGDSGTLTGPHLHFQVENLWNESLPFAFANEQGCSLQVQTGDWITATPVALSHLLHPSELPTDAFAEFGVAYVTGLPGRLFEHSETIQLKGESSSLDATTAHFLVAGADGGQALYKASFDIDKAGRFQGQLNLRSLAPGTYSVALTVGSKLKIEVPRSIRIALVE